MKRAQRALRSAVGLAACWLSGLVPAPLRAEAPACIELSLPAQLPARAAWMSLLQQETKSLLEDGAHGCAQIEVFEDPSEGAALSLQVAWLGRARMAPLTLGEVPPREHARAAALIARGLLQQLLQESVTPSPTLPAAPPSGAATHSDDRETQSSQPKPKAKQPKLAERQATPPKAPPASALLPTSAGPRPLERDIELPPRTRRTRTAWSGSVLGGSAVVLSSLTALVHVELGAQRSFLPQHTRLALALTGVFAPTRAYSGTVRLGGPGLRGAVDFLLVTNRLRRVWLGAGASAMELVLGRRVAEQPDTVHSYHTVVAVDLRASFEIAVSPDAYFLIVLEASYPLRYLKVRRETQELLAYAGPMIGLRLGVSF
jgi:hypothetical protein